MEHRNESLLTMFFRMMGYSIAQQDKHPEQSTEAAFFSVLFDPDPSLASNGSWPAVRRSRGLDGGP